MNIAEESTLITDLGIFVLKQACEQSQQWRSEGLGAISVAVNLSPRQLRDTNLKSHTAKNDKGKRHLVRMP